ncbi:MAG: SBBP repeat-containing protein [Candidatus Helarchaeota archaeon]
MNRKLKYVFPISLIIIWASLIFFFSPISQIIITTPIHDDMPLTVIESSNNPTYTEKWNKTFGGIEEDIGYGVAIDADDYVYLVGSTKNYGTNTPSYSNAMLVKFDLNGNVIWYRTWGYDKTDIGYDVAVDNAHNVYIVGSTQNLPVSGRNLFVAKYDGNGNQLWNRTWGGIVSADIEGYSIAIDKNNNLYITGKMPGASFDMFVVKYNSSGAEIWNKTWGSTGIDSGKGIAVDSQNDVYIVGTYYDTSSANDLIFINKYSCNGTFQWTRKLGSNKYTDYGEGIAIDKNNNIYIVGSINNTGTSSYDIVVAKYDSLGNLIWEKYYGNSKKDYGYDIAIDGYNNIYISGSKEYYCPARNIYFMKIDSSGNILFNTTWGGVGYSDMYGYAIAVSPGLDVYIGGAIPSGSNRIAILIKYRYIKYVPIIAPGFQFYGLLISLDLIIIGIIIYRLIKSKSKNIKFIEKIVYVI